MSSPDAVRLARLETGRGALLDSAAGVESGGRSPGGEVTVKKHLMALSCPADAISMAKELCSEHRRIIKENRTSMSARELAKRLLEFEARRRLQEMQGATTPAGAAEVDGTSGDAAREPHAADAENSVDRTRILQSLRYLAPPTTPPRASPGQPAPSVPSVAEGVADLKGLCCFYCDEPQSNFCKVTGRRHRNDSSISADKEDSDSDRSDVDGDAGRGVNQRLGKKSEHRRSRGRRGDRHGEVDDHGHSSSRQSVSNSDGDGRVTPGPLGTAPANTASMPNDNGESCSPDEVRTAPKHEANSGSPVTDGGAEDVVGGSLSSGSSAPPSESVKAPVASDSALPPPPPVPALSDEEDDDWFDQVNNRKPPSVAA